jgi:hypothetical protein
MELIYQLRLLRDKIKPSERLYKKINQLKKIIMTAQPKKRQPCQIYSRVVGYLSPIDRWNSGKKEEFKDRKEYKIK